MIFTPGERRLVTLLIVFLGSAYLISGLRACRLLPGPSADPAAPAGGVAAPSPATPDDSRDDGSGERAEDSSRAGGPPAAARHAAADGRDIFSGGYLDLNAADSLALVALPGIGPALAGRILAARVQRGRFSRLEDLLDVTGIGAKRLEQLRPYLIVAAPDR
jgi:competence protein ComEA